MANALSICPIHRHGLVTDISTRQSRYGSITLRCPKYSRETEGGRTFAVAAVKEWNKLPINIRSSQNVKPFKQNYVNYFKDSCTRQDSAIFLFLQSFYFSV